MAFFWSLLEKYKKNVFLRTFIEVTGWVLLTVRNQDSQSCNTSSILVRSTKGHLFVREVVIFLAVSYWLLAFSF